MSWAAVDNIRCVDIWAGNLDANGNIRGAELLAKQPAVAIARAAGGQVTVDQTYSKALAQLAGPHIEPYLVVNTTKPLQAAFTVWDSQVLVPRPKAIWMDCERSDGQTRDHITGYLKDVFAEAPRRWPWAKVGCYTAAWWWNVHVTHGWEAAIPLWDAMYPFFEQSPVDGSWHQAYSFEVVDRLLPIGNSFTPRIPAGWLGIAQPVIWQFSEKGSGGYDLNYVSRAWYQSLYGGGQPPVTAKPRVEVRHPGGVEVIVTEV